MPSIHIVSTAGAVEQRTIVAVEPGRKKRSEGRYTVGVVGQDIVVGTVMAAVAAVEERRAGSTGLAGKVQMQMFVFLGSSNTYGLLILILLHRLLIHGLVRLKSSLLNRIVVQRQHVSNRNVNLSQRVALSVDAGEMGIDEWSLSIGSSFQLGEILRISTFASRITLVEHLKTADKDCFVD